MDFIGQRRFFSTALIVYTLGATAAAFVHTSAWFLFLQVTQAYFLGFCFLCSVGIFFSMSRERLRQD